jgi:hypothetical protein
MHVPGYRFLYWIGVELYTPNWRRVTTRQRTSSVSGWSSRKCAPRLSVRCNEAKARMRPSNARLRTESALSSSSPLILLDPRALGSIRIVGTSSHSIRTPHDGGLHQSKFDAVAGKSTRVDMLAIAVNSGQPLRCCCLGNRLACIGEHVALLDDHRLNAGRDQGLVRREAALHVLHYIKEFLDLSNLKSLAR